MKCLECGMETTNPKFCNNSCAAKFNNRNRRPRTIESRLKTSESMYRYMNNNPEKVAVAHIKAGQSNRENHTLKPKIRQCSWCKQEFNERVRNSTLCSDECYINMKKYNAKGIKRQEYNGVVFDSGYEVLIAKYLDAHNIIWIRPTNAVYWFDSNGKQRRYFPDFYLPKYDIYLDPKNSYCISQQIEKLNVVSKLIKLIYGEPKFIISQIESLV